MFCLFLIGLKNNNILIIKNKIGEIYKSNNFGIVKIIEYFDSCNCTIQFEDNTIIKNVEYNQIKKGQVKNPNHKSVYGVGYLGQGKSTNRKIYLCWKEVFKRCYSEKQIEKQPTYKDVTVCEEWHNFQNFAQWYEENYIEGFALDKDILIKGNKVYSPETCCFVPQEINNLLTKRENKRGGYPIGVILRKSGKFQAQITINNLRKCLGTFDTPYGAFRAYKTAKEKEIKRIAAKWKDKITDQTYQAMYNYKVEITD